MAKEIHRFNIEDKEILITKNKFLGKIQVSIDGVPVKNHISFVIGTKEIDFKVNDKNVKLTVVIPVFANYRAWEWIISVDGKEIERIRK